MTWAALVNKSEACEDFHKSFLRAASRVSDLTKASDQNMMCEAVENTVTLGYQTSREYYFWTEREFEEKFAVPPGEVGASVEVITDEHGKKTSGVLMAATQTPRKVTLYSNNFLQHDECVLRPDEQVRENQGRDIMQWLHDDIQKARPKALRSGQFGFCAAPTLEELENLVKKRQEEKVLEEEERRLEAQRATATAEDAVQEEPQPPSSESEDEFEDAAECRLTLPSQRARVAKAKAKNRAKAKARSKEKALQKSRGKSLSQAAPARSLQTLLAASSANSAAASEAGASMLPPSIRVKTEDASNRSSSGSDVTSFSEVESKIHDVNLNRMLAGDLLGDKVYNCRRKADELQAKDPGSSDLVLLRAHLHLAGLAKDWGGNLVIRWRRRVLVSESAHSRTSCSFVECVCV